MIRGIRIGLFLLFLYGCSSDINPIIDAAETDQNNQQIVEEFERRTFDITVIASREGDEYQIDIDNFTLEDYPVTNLTQELSLSLETPYFSSIEGTTISYLRGRNQEHRVGQKDVLNATAFSADNYCPLENEEGVGKFIYFTRANEHRILYVYTESRIDEPETFYIRIFNKDDNSCTTIPVDPNPFNGLRSAILQGNFLALKYNSEDGGSPVVSLYDIISGQKINSFELDSLFRSATLRSDELVIFGQDGSYRIYDIFTKELIATGFLDILVGIENDLFIAQFYGNQLLYDLYYSQPSPIVSQPAIFDIEANRFLKGTDFYFFDLRERMIEALGALVVLTTYEVDMESGEIILGYDLNDGSGGGGIVFTNFENEVRKVVQLDYVPYRIIVRKIN